MKNFIKKHKICITGITYLFILGATYFFVANPLLKKIEEKNNLIQEKIATQENNREKISKLPLFKDQFDKIEADEDKIKIGLTSSNVVNLLEKIEEISGETGNKVKLEIMDDSTEKEKTTPKSKKSAAKEEKKIIDKLPIERHIVINIKLAGGYKNLIEFINKIESAEYYSDIISIKVNKDLLKNSSSNPFESEELENAQKEMREIKNEIYSDLSVAFYLDK